MNIVQQLEKFLRTPVDPELFPVRKGNRLLIGQFEIVEAKSSYLVKHKNAAVIGRTNNLISAVALAKEAKRKQSCFAEIFRLDRIISKQKQDSQFYRTSLRTTKDQDRREILETKIENAASKIQECKQKLDTYIFPRRINTFITNNREQLDEHQ